MLPDIWDPACHTHEIEMWPHIHGYMLSSNVNNDWNVEACMFLLLEKGKAEKPQANVSLASVYEGKCNILDCSLLSSNGRASSFHSCAFGRVGGRGLSWGEGGRFCSSTGSKGEASLAPAIPLPCSPLPPPRFPKWAAHLSAGFQHQLLQKATCSWQSIILTDLFLTVFTMFCLRLGLLSFYFPPNQKYFQHRTVTPWSDSWLVESAIFCAWLYTWWYLRHLAITNHQKIY